MISLNALFCSIICDGMVQSVFVESLMHQSPIMTQKKKIEYLRNVGGTLKVFIEKKEICRIRHENENFDMNYISFL